MSCNRLITHLIFLFLIFVFGSECVGQIFSTTSFGTVGANSSPTGWTAISSPDYSSISINGYDANTSWINTLPAAPNGDTTFPVVRSTTPSEGISQTITGLSTGVAYTFTIHYMYPTAVGTYATRFNRPVYQLAYARFNNGTNQYLDSFGYSVSANTWFTQTFTVVSTGSSMVFELGITGLNSNRAAVAFSLNTISTPAFLPVDFISFAAEPTLSNTVKLSWTTASEVNNKGFAVQRSSDNESWNELDFINGRNAIEKSKYNFEDKRPLSGESYYRLVQLDFNGDQSYSTTQTVNFGSEIQPIHIYPNPTEGLLYIKQALGGKPILLEIVNMNGKVIFNENLKTNTIDLSQVRAGMYILTCYVDGKVEQRKKLLKE